MIVTEALEVASLTEKDLAQGPPPADRESGFGGLRTPRGLLPLQAMDVRGRIDGLFAEISVEQVEGHR